MASHLPGEHDGGMTEGMSEPAKVPMEKRAPADELLWAKQSVLATVAGAAGTTPASIKARAPIRPLPADTAARITARVQAGLEPLGSSFPRSATFHRVVLPSALLAVLDALAFVVALAAGQAVLAVVAAVLFVVLACVALAGQRYVRGDPLRLTARDRLGVVNAGRWSSDQRWAGPIASTRECALVVAAARAGQRIVGSTSWTSGQLANSGVQLALAAELDQLDAEAFAIASRRYRDFPGGLPGTPVASSELDRAWDKLVTRVAALTGYADTLDGLDRYQDAALRQGGPVDDATLLGPGQRDVEALAFFLSASIYDLD